MRAGCRSCAPPARRSSSNSSKAGGTGVQRKLAHEILTEERKAAAEQGRSERVSGSTRLDSSQPHRVRCMCHCAAVARTRWYECGFLKCAMHGGRKLTHLRVSRRRIACRHTSSCGRGRIELQISQQGYSEIRAPAKRGEGRERRGEKRRSG